MDACREFDVAYIGGDLGKSKEITLTGVAVGFGNSLMKRNGCRPGDDLWVTGTFGWTGLAYAEAFEGITLAKDVYQEVHQKILCPMPRIRAGVLLRGIANSCIDSSDGLAISLHHLATESEMDIFLEKLPVDAKIDREIDMNSLDRTKTVCYAGEELELVFSASPSNQKRIQKVFETAGMPAPIKIGTAKSCSSGKPTVVDRTGKIEQPLHAQGWDIFKNQPKA